MKKIQNWQEKKKTSKGHHIRTREGLFNVFHEPRKNPEIFFQPGTNSWAENASGSRVEKLPSSTFFRRSFHYSDAKSDTGILICISVDFGIRLWRAFFRFISRFMRVFQFERGKGKSSIKNGSEKINNKNEKGTYRSRGVRIFQFVTKASVQQ